MHEFSLAQGLFSQILQLAESHGAQKIITVRVEVGKLSGIVVDSFSFGFEILSKEKKLTENAILEIREVNPDKICLDCDSTFPSSEHVLNKCPDCGSLNFTFTGGDDLILTQVEME